MIYVRPEGRDDLTTPDAGRGVKGTMDKRGRKEENVLKN